MNTNNTPQITMNDLATKIDKIDARIDGIDTRVGSLSTEMRAGFIRLENKIDSSIEELAGMVKRQFDETGAKIVDANHGLDKKIDKGFTELQVKIDRKTDSSEIEELAQMVARGFKETGHGSRDHEIRIRRVERKLQVA